MPKYNNFYTDTYNTGLYFRTNKKTLVSADSLLNPTSEVKEPLNYSDAACSNGDLYVKCYDEISKWDANHYLSTAKMYADKSDYPLLEGIEANYLGTYNGDAIGNIKNKIYTKKQYDGPWKFKLTLPFNTDSGTLQMGHNSNILFIGSNDTASFCEIPSGKIKTKRLSSMLPDFTKSPLRKITFENGTSGCFDYETNYITYAAGTDEFVLGEEHRSGNGALSGYNDYLATQTIENWKAKLPVIVCRLSTIEHLGFTGKDYAKCKKDILDFQQRLSAGKTSAFNDGKGFYFPKNNLDFELLLSMVDSIKTLMTLR